MEYEKWWVWAGAIGVLLVVITASHLGFFRSGDIDYSGDDVLYEEPPQEVRVESMNNESSTEYIELPPPFNMLIAASICLCRAS